MADEIIILTQDGKKKLEEELRQLKNVERAKNAHEIEVARSFGDLSENAEYEAAKNEQARIEGRIGDIEGILNKAVIAEAGAGEEGVVGIGSHVKVFDMEYKAEDVYTVVGATEADPSRLFVSTESPIGKELMGKKAGETVKVQTPGGLLELKILAVSK